MKKRTLKVETRRTQSYNGTWLSSSNVEIEVYDKNCGSPSCLTICLEERTEKGRRNIISDFLEKEQVLELKKILNELEF